MGKSWRKTKTKPVEIQKKQRAFIPFVSQNEVWDLRPLHDRFAKKTNMEKPPYYRCITGAKPNYYDACGSRMVRADKAEAVVWRTIDGALRDRKTIFESINIKKQEHDPALSRPMKYCW